KIQSACHPPSPDQFLDFACGSAVRSQSETVSITSGSRRKKMRILAGARFNYIGIPTTGRFEGEIDLPHLKITVSDHQDNPFGIQWQRYWEDASCPDLVKTVPHLAFEVDVLAVGMGGYRGVVEPK